MQALLGLQRGRDRMVIAWRSSPKMRGYKEHTSHFEALRRLQDCKTSERLRVEATGH
jgi:hypothetical protein